MMGWIFETFFWVGLANSSHDWKRSKILGILTDGGECMVAVADPSRLDTWKAFTKEPERRRGTVAKREEVPNDLHNRERAHSHQSGDPDTSIYSPPVGRRLRGSA